MTRKRRGRQQSPLGAEVEGKTSQRALRVGEEPRHALAKILHDGGCRDPLLENASITVTEVRMSPDLRNATAFVMPLAGTNATEVVAGLERSATFLKGLVAPDLQLPNTPNLIFALVDSIHRADPTPPSF